MPFKVKDLMIDIATLQCSQHTLIHCGGCSLLAVSFCHWGCSVQFSPCICTYIHSHCFTGSIVPTFPPTCGFSGDPTPWIRERTPQLDPREIAGLKEGLKSALTAAEAAEKAQAEQLAPQTVADVEMLEGKLQEALAELKTQKAALQKKG